MYKANFNDISSSGVVVLTDAAKKIIEDYDTTMAEAGHSTGKHR